MAPRAKKTQSSDPPTIERKRVLFVDAGDKATLSASLRGTLFIVVVFSAQRYVVLTSSAVRRALARKRGAQILTWADVATRARRTPQPAATARENKGIEIPAVVLHEGALAVAWRGESPGAPRSAAKRSFELESTILLRDTNLESAESKERPAPRKYTRRTVARDRSPEAAGEPFGAHTNGVATPVSSEPPAGFIKTALNALFEGHDHAAPLQKGEPYVLAFDTGAAAADAAKTIEANIPIGAGAEEVVLTIQLTSETFTIEQPWQPLHIRRNGRSRGRARFDVSPSVSGTATIDVIVKSDGNFLQKLTIETHVDEPGQQAIGNVTTVGRELGAAETVKHRDLVLIVQETGGGFVITASAETVATARLPMTDVQVDSVAAAARAKLQEIVNYFDANLASFVYQSQITIPEEIHKPNLIAAAKAGHSLFKALFFGPAADAQLKLLGKGLIARIAGPPLDIQIITTRVLIPWGLLYVAEEFNANAVDINRFLGFAHRIEQIPLQQGWTVSGAEIRHNADLRIGVNLNNDIDTEMDALYVRQQEAFFRDLGAGKKANVTVHHGVGEIQETLTTDVAANQLLYFFCHAKAGTISDTGDEAYWSSKGRRLSRFVSSRKSSLSSRSRSAVRR
jgi:hypothetical protein